MAECPVCVDTVMSPNNSMGCGNRHLICLKCASRTVKPCHFCKSSQCTGLVMSCPICRLTSTVRPKFALAMLQGSWAAANGLHASKHAKAYWDAQGEIVNHVVPEYSSSDDSGGESEDMECAEPAGVSSLAEGQRARTAVPVAIRQDPQARDK